MKYVINLLPNTKADAGSDYLENYYKEIIMEMFYNYKKQEKEGSEAIFARHIAAFSRALGSANSLAMGHLCNLGIITTKELIENIDKYTKITLLELEENKLLQLQKEVQDEI